MSIADLLMDLQSRGVEITAKGERLKIRAPRGAVTPELRQRLAASKPAVLAVLKGSSDSEWRCVDGFVPAWILTRSFCALF